MLAATNTHEIDESVTGMKMWNWVDACLYAQSLRPYIKEADEFWRRLIEADEDPQKQLHHDIQHVATGKHPETGATTGPGHKEYDAASARLGSHEQPHARKALGATARRQGRDVSDVSTDLHLPHEKGGKETHIQRIAREAHAEIKAGKTFTHQNLGNKLAHAAKIGPATEFAVPGAGARGRKSAARRSKHEKVGLPTKQGERGEEKIELPKATLTRRERRSPEQVVTPKARDPFIAGHPAVKTSLSSAQRSSLSTTGMMGKMYDKHREAGHSHDEALGKLHHQMTQTPDPKDPSKKYPGPSRSEIEKHVDRHRGGPARPKPLPARPAKAAPPKLAPDKPTKAERTAAHKKVTSHVHDMMTGAVKSAQDHSPGHHAVLRSLHNRILGDLWKSHGDPEHKVKSFADHVKDMKKSDAGLHTHLGISNETHGKPEQAAGTAINKIVHQHTGVHPKKGPDQPAHGQDVIRQMARARQQRVKAAKPGLKKPKPETIPPEKGGPMGGIKEPVKSPETLAKEKQAKKARELKVRGRRGLEDVLKGEREKAKTREPKPEVKAAAAKRRAETAKQVSPKVKPVKTGLGLPPGQPEKGTPAKRLSPEQADKARKLLADQRAARKAAAEKAKKMKPTEAQRARGYSPGLERTKRVSGKIRELAQKARGDLPALPGKVSPKKAKTEESISLHDRLFGNTLAEQVLSLFDKVHAAA